MCRNMLKRVHRFREVVINLLGTPTTLALVIVIVAGCHTKHTGWFDVNSQPQGARIWENDLGDLGQTPLRILVSRGCGLVFPDTLECQKRISASIHAALPGYQEAVRNVGVTDGSTIKVFFLLEPIAKTPAIRLFKTQLFVDSDPHDALISVDGRYMGRTPATIALDWSTATRRTKTLVVRKTGYTDETKEVTPQDDRVVVVLQPIKARER